MRAIRLFLLLSFVALGGVAIVHPESVLPFALGFIEPLLADPQTPPGDYGSEATALSATARSSAETEAAASDLKTASVQQTNSGATATASAPQGVASIANPGDRRRTVVLVAEADPPKPHVSADADAHKPDAAAADEHGSAANKAPDTGKPVEPTLGSLTPKPDLTPEEFYPGGSKIVSAKNLFGSAKTPAPLAARSIGFYAKGCLSGAVALPVDGPAWQAMRVARNRYWGNPELIKLVEQLANDAKAHDGWSGLLVGDISQPRGGPMLNGHASHQVGLDADIWLTPMPDHSLTTAERDNMPATSMLDSTNAAVDPKVFTDKQVALIKRAASYSEVERVFVHPAIKKALCLAAGKDRKWLAKVRQIPGHYYHFHIRIKCPHGFAGCQGQPPVTGDEGCGKSLDKWLNRIKAASAHPHPRPPPPQSQKPPKPPVASGKTKPPPPPLMLSQLPKECSTVLESGDSPVSIPKEALGPPPTPPKPKPAPKPAVAAAGHAKGATGAVPAPAAAPAAATAPAVAPAVSPNVTLRPVKQRYAKPAKP